MALYKFVYDMRIVWLPDAKKLKIYLFLSTEYTNVTDGRTDRQTDAQTAATRRHMPRYA